jgi:hypothetical protein
MKMLAIALIATILALIQNGAMFAFGVKEMAIASAPLSFIGIFLAELAVIWGGYVACRKLRRRRSLLFGLVSVAVLGGAELALPVSSFKTMLGLFERERMFGRIEVASHSAEKLADQSGKVRLAVTYTLRFPFRSGGAT